MRCMDEYAGGQQEQWVLLGHQISSGAMQALMLAVSQCKTWNPGLTPACILQACIELARSLNREMNKGVHRARREFAQMAFTHAGMPLRWEGKAGTLTETGVVASGELKGRTVIRVNAKYFRPAEVSSLKTLNK